MSKEIEKAVRIVGAALPMARLTVEEHQTVQENFGKIVNFLKEKGLFKDESDNGNLHLQESS